MKKLIFSVLTPLCLHTGTQAQDVLRGTAGSTITVQNGATLYVGGNLTLENTSTLNNAGTITIARNGAPTADFTDNTPAPHSYGNGSFIFTGTGGVQNMLGSLFYNLEINNASGVNMLGSQTVNNNLLLTSGSLGLAGYTLTINGPVTGTGNLSGSSTSALVIGGTAGTINFNQASAATRSLNNLTFNSGASATLGNALEIYGTVALTSASLDLNAKNLTLKSTPTNTARIADLSGSSLTGGTNVTMERFIKLRTPGTGAGAANYGRAYRLICPTVNTTGHPTKPTIRDNWMEGGLVNSIGGTSNPVTNYGTHITGPGGNANGFDVTQTNQSSFYNTANAIVPTYSAIANTGSSLNPLTGYFLYLRGDRSVSTQVPLGANMPTTSTTLRATGTVVTGPVSSFTNAFTGGGTLNLVTNPYPSPIDWQLVRAASTGITDYYTYWDPNYGTRGGFVTVSSAETGPLRYIQSGQAFFVESNGVGTPVVNMLESHKAAGNNNDVFLVPPPPAEAFAVQLYFTEPSNYRRLSDEADAWYGSNYSTAVNEDDAREINNWDENISIRREGKNLAIEQRPVIVLRDTLPLFMNNMKQQAYEFEFRPQAFTNTSLVAELVDNFLNLRTPLSVIAPSVVSFNITADPASSASNRFMVVFGPGRPLAIDVITIQARAKNNPQGPAVGVQVDWQAKTETDMEKYEVEKSVDGSNFSKQNTTAAIGNSTSPVNYGWFDAAPVKGNNFYRVKAYDKAGAIKYTSIVKVNIGKAEPAITVMPNPVSSNAFGLQLTDLEKGTYTLILYNNLGQQVYNTKLQHDGGSAIKRIQPDATLANGSYRLLLLGENNVRLTAAIIKN
ncbi:MAG: hypothetical protein JNM14_05915 [Ferruginibacter sp.]|nr:hypothetical protein [Ferruginibacter sp.]